MVYNHSKVLRYGQWCHNWAFRDSAGYQHHERKYQKAYEKLRDTKLPDNWRELDHFDSAGAHAGPQAATARLFGIYFPLICLFPLFVILGCLLAHDDLVGPSTLHNPAGALDLGALRGSWRRSATPCGARRGVLRDRAGICAPVSFLSAVSASGAPGMVQNGPRGRRDSSFPSNPEKLI